MSYLTEAEFITRHGADFVTVLTDRDDDCEEDSPIISEVILDVDAIIDSHVGVNYELPLAETPRELKRIADDLLVYYLAQDAPTMTENIEKKFDNAMVLLKRIADKKMSLNLPTTSEEAPEQGGGIEHSQETRQWTATTTRGLF